MNEKRSPSPRPSPMNRPSPGLRPPSPRLAGRGQGEGCQSGSWSQCVRKSERRLSTNPEEHRTSNIQCRTSNGRRESSITSAFEVRCSTFDVSPSVREFQRTNVHFGEFSPPGEGRVASPPSVIPHSLAMLSAVCVLSLPMSVLGNEVEEKQTIQKTFVFDDAR